MTQQNESGSVALTTNPPNTSFNPDGSKPDFILSGGKDNRNIDASILGEVYLYILSSEWGKS